MKLLGVGVDLVSISRVRKFLTQHSPERILRLLSPAEKKRHQKRKISAITLAKIFSAKEAFFKTLDASWMGLEGFPSLQVTPLSGDRFFIEAVSGVLRLKARGKAEGCFFRAGNLLGAQVIRWEPDTAGSI